MNGNDELNDKSTIDYKLATASEFVSLGKYLHAMQIYASILEEDPNNIEANFNLAEIYIQTGKLELVVSLLKKLLESEPENQEARLYFGQLMLRNSRWHEAINVLSYIMPNEKPVVSFFLGYANFMLQDYEIAKINFENYLKHGGENELLYEANLFLAKIEVEVNNYESALEFLKKTEPLYSNYWELHYYYAKCYYSLGMDEHSVLAIEKAIKFNPKEIKNYSLAGKIYLKDGEYLKAENNFKKFIELSQDISSEIYAELGEACLGTKKPKDALNYFELALKIDPANDIAHKGKISASKIINNSFLNNA